MKPAPFGYFAAATVDEATELLAADPEAKVLAGGQSLLPLLALRLAQPSTLVDLGGVAGLSGITGETGGLRIGATTRHYELAAQTEHPLLAEAARWIGHEAIRSRGTIGGSVAHADPAAEWPAVLCALDAELEIAGPAASQRTAGVSDGFFQGHLQTTLAEGEVLTSIRVPRPRRWGFAELARRAGDFALVLVVAAELDDGWRLVAGGVASTPVRLREAEALLDAGSRTEASATQPGTIDSADIEPSLIDEVAEAAAAAVEPVPSLHAGTRYLEAMTAELTRRALQGSRP